MRGVILGTGEVGSSLYKVLKKTYPDIRMYGKHNETHWVDILHICFPYSKSFVKEVKRYKKLHKPKYIVIHSTVPIGTSKKLEAFHSPIRGVHPNLDKGIKTFVKYLAPKNRKLVRYFKKAGIKIKNVDNSEDTEAGKIWSTTAYGWNIALEKMIYQHCKENNLDFDIVYTDFTKTYNDGYEKLKMFHVKRPILKHISGKIGGHCIIPNLKFLKSNVSNIIKKINQNC